MELPKGTQESIEQVKNLPENTLEFHLVVKIPPTYGLNSQAYTGVEAVSIPEYELALVANPQVMFADATKALRNRAAFTFYTHLEAQPMTLTPTREQLADMITQAEEELGEMTPQMLADYLLLKMSEQPQIVRPYQLKDAAAEVAPKVYQYHNMPLHPGEMESMFKLTTNGLRLGVAAYLNTLAKRNVNAIKGDSNG